MRRVHHTITHGASNLKPSQPHAAHAVARPPSPQCGPTVLCRKLTLLFSASQVVLSQIPNLESACEWAAMCVRPGPSVFYFTSLSSLGITCAFQLSCRVVSGGGTGDHITPAEFGNGKPMHHAAAALGNLLLPTFALAPNLPHRNSTGRHFLSHARCHSFSHAGCPPWGPSQ